MDVNELRKLVEEAQAELLNLKNLVMKIQDRHKKLLSIAVEIVRFWTWSAVSNGNIGCNFIKETTMPRQERMESLVQFLCEEGRIERIKDGYFKIKNGEQDNANKARE